MTDLMSPTEVAELLKINRSTVHRMVHRGDLPAIRLHGVMRIPRKAVERYFQTKGALSPNATLF
jgi:excisionase family DNA binding protein